MNNETTYTVYQNNLSFPNVFNEYLKSVILFLIQHI